MYKNIFSKRLRALRKKKGLTQTQLAEQAKMSQQVINIYENEKQFPRLENIIILAKVLDTSVDFLCGITDIESSMEKELLFKENYDSKEIFKSIIILMQSNYFQFNKNDIKINNLDISNFIEEILELKKIDNTLQNSNLTNSSIDIKKVILEKANQTKITKETEMDFKILK